MAAGAANQSSNSKRSAGLKSAGGVPADGEYVTVVDGRRSEPMETGSIIESLERAAAVGQAAVDALAGLGDLSVSMRSTLTARAHAGTSEAHRKNLYRDYREMVIRAGELVDSAMVDGINLLRHSSPDLFVRSHPLGGNLVLRAARMGTVGDDGRGMGLDRWVEWLGENAQLCLEGGGSGLDGYEAAVLRYWSRLSDDLSMVHRQIVFLESQPDPAELRSAIGRDAAGARAAAQRTALEVQRLLSGQPLGITNRCPHALVEMFR